MRYVATFLFLFTSLLFGQRAPFQFAWLSDTHVGGTTGNEDLRASVKDINQLTAVSGQQSGTSVPKFVVLSGDITEYGSCEQLELAKQILDSLTLPYYIIPGNHDTKWSESGATYFPKIFKADRFVFDQNGIKFIGMHQGPLMKMGDGHWAPQDVRWIDSVLTHLPDPQQPIVFVTHYPLGDEIANWYEVLDRLKTVNTQVALVGHGHANRKMTFEGIPGVMGRSNLRARGSVGGFTIVDVRDDSLFFSERTIGTTTNPTWHRLPLVRRQSLPAIPTPARPSFAVNDQYPNIRHRWQVATGYTIASTPAVWKGLTIVGDASGMVRALRLKDGSAAWTFRANDAVYSTPAVADDIVVFASADGCIYALDAAAGTLKWRVQTGRAIVASPVIEDETVYIGASDGQFRAIDLASGNLKWIHDGIRGFVETKPLVYEGKIIFGAWDGNLYALNAKDGAQCWRWSGDKPGALLSPAACWPIGAEGMVFVVAPDRKMTAIDAATGQQIWRTAAHQVRESIGLSEDGDRFYVRTMQDSIIAFSTEGQTPTMLWGIDAGFGYDINSAMLVEQDGIVYYGTKNGLLLAIDGETGKIRWKHRIGVALLNTVVPLGDGDLLVTDFDGRVMRIGEMRK
jgi:outer membrane protein assembly factor BamB/predicted phosphodiesterase